MPGHYGDKMMPKGTKAKPMAKGTKKKPIKKK